MRVSNKIKSSIILGSIGAIVPLALKKKKKAVIIASLIMGAVGYAIGKPDISTPTTTGNSVPTPGPRPTTTPSNTPLPVPRYDPSPAPPQSSDYTDSIKINPTKDTIVPREM